MSVVATATLMTSTAVASAEPVYSCTREQVTPGRVIGADGSPTFGPDGKSAAAVLQHVRVFDPETNETTEELGELWRDGPVLLHLVRRFGCPLCREAASEISTLKRPGLRMVAVGCQDVGWEEFNNGGFFSGRVLVDKDKEAFRALGLRRSGLWDGYGFLDFRSWAAVVRTVTKGVPGDLKGDGFQMGATLVLLPDGTCVYDHRMQSMGDKPDVAELESVLDKVLSPSTGNKDEL